MRTRCKNAKNSCGSHYTIFIMQILKWSRPMQQCETLLNNVNWCTKQMVTEFQITHMNNRSEIEVIAKQLHTVYAHRFWLSCMYLCKLNFKWSWVSVANCYAFQFNVSGCYAFMQRDTQRCSAVSCCCFRIKDEIIISSLQALSRSRPYQHDTTSFLVNRAFLA